MDRVSARAEGHAPIGSGAVEHTQAGHEVGGIGPMKVKVLKASLWAMVQNSAPKLVSFCAFLILANFLTPDEIGIAAAIGAILALAELLCEQGFGDALVQRSQVTDTALNFVFWAVLGAGAAAAIILLLTAQHLSLLLRAPQLESYIRIVALYLPVAGLGVVQQAIYRRRLEYRWLGVRSAVAAVGSACLALAVAWMGGGAWALIVQIVAFGVLSATLLWVGAPFRPAFALSAAEASGIYRYSRYIVGAKLVEFVASRSIEFIILGRLGAAALGAYFLGAKLAQTALHVMSPPLLDVAHAVFSRAGGDSERARALYLRGLTACGLIAVPIMVQLSALSNDVTALIYGANGADAGPVLGYLSLLGALSCISYVNASFMSASGRPGWTMLLTLVRAVVISALLLLAHADDVSQIVLILAGTEAVLFPGSILLATRIARISVLQWLERIWVMAVAAAVMYLAMVWLGEHALSGMPPLLRMLLLGPLGGGLFLLAVQVLSGTPALSLLYGSQEGSAEAAPNAVKRPRDAQGGEASRRGGFAMPEIPIIVITLNRSDQRFDSIRRQLSGFGLAPFRLRAIDGRRKSSMLKRIFGRGFYCDKLGRDMSLGEIGCFASHVKALRYIIKHHIPRAIILEDDAEFGDGFGAFYRSDLPRMLDTLDVLKLEGTVYPHVSRDGVTVAQGGDTRAIVPLRPSLCAAAYAVTLRGARDIAAVADRVSEPFDFILVHYERYWARYGELRPFLVRQSGVTSTIGDDVRNDRREDPPLSLQAKVHKVVGRLASAGRTWTLACAASPSLLWAALPRTGRTSLANGVSRRIANSVGGVFDRVRSRVAPAWPVQTPVQKPVQKNASIDIGGSRYRLGNRGRIPPKAIDVQVGRNLGNDDMARPGEAGFKSDAGGPNALRVGAHQASRRREMSSPKVALITGITGQDGAHLARLLLDRGYVVHGVKRRSSSFNTARVDDLYVDPHEGDTRFFMHHGDMTDATNLIRLVQEHQPTEIYNLAAQSHVHVSFETPEYTANADALGTLRLLEALRILGVKDRVRFYQASTSELYGKVREKPQRETTPFYPRSPYAAAKLYAYWITVNYREAYGLHASNGILFNHEGPMRGETFVTRKITRAVAGIERGLQQRLYLGNLDAQRDWGHARDFVHGMWLMLQQPEPDDYVLATGEMHSVREFVERAFKHVGRRIEWRGSGVDEVGIDAATGKDLVRIDPRYFRPTEVDELRGDASKARAKLGWTPKTTFAELVAEMVERDLVLADREAWRNDRTA